MPETSLFGAWESFYVIVGSSGGALTGLQFVVMALIAEGNQTGSKEAVGAFSTPTVVHFCMVLGIAAILSAPWHSMGGPTVILALAAIAGTAYSIVVTMRTRRQNAYKPVLEDWIWHSVLPIAAYLLLLIGALSLRAGEGAGMFEIAGTSLLLLFIGIHNAWDTIAYIATVHMRGD